MVAAECFLDVFKSTLSTPRPGRQCTVGQDMEAFKRIIEAMAEPGDLIVDPFTGGGTTLLPLSTGRQCHRCRAMQRGGFPTGATDHRARCGVGRR